MKRSLFTIAAIAALAIASQVHTGAKEKEDMDHIRANYYFNHLAFHEAIPYYEKLSETDTSTQILIRLADCYRLTGNITAAADWYKKVIDKPKCGDVVMLRYGQMLMELMQYEEAAKWLKEYQKNNPRDRRVANLIAGCASARGRLEAAKGEPTLLAFNTDHSEFAPTLWNGSLVFAADTAISVTKRTSKWSGNSCYNIYTVLCDDAGNCGDELHTLGHGKQKNIAWHDGPATFSADGSEMYFTRTRYNEKFLSRGPIANKDSIVVLEIMIASDYDEGAQQFSKVTPFAFNNQGATVAHPTISSDGKTIIFSSTQRGNGSDLYICRKNPKGKWLKPQNLGPNINTEGEEVFPFLLNDSTLCFASDGHEGLGGLDLYISHWDSTQQAFAVPQNMGAPLNSSYDDISMAILPDGTGGYFSSNRPAEKASDNIYYYRKP